MIKVKVYSVATSGAECVMLLEEADGPRLLPIWIGIAEGQAIALKFANVTLPRPLTHDLMINTMKTLGYKVDRVVVSDLKGQTFYAQIHISHNSSKHVIDSRPSDAIALAVRAECEIYVDDKVFEKCHTMSKPISEEEVKSFKEEIKNLKPEDIIKGIKDKEGKKKGTKPPKEMFDAPDEEEEGGGGDEEEDDEEN